MKKSSLKSKIIIDLKEKIEQGDCNELQGFWDSIEIKGSPIIEKINGDLENVLVTFLYKAEEEIENVVFIPPIGWNNLSENKMERLLETNLWYITYEIRNDVRFDYFFSVNDSFDDDWEKREKKLIRDKYNKHKLILNDEEIVPYVIMPNSEEHFWVKERQDVPKGKLYEHKFHSEKLEKDRSIRIYTPNGYEEDNKPYGFLLLTDGAEYIAMLSNTTLLDNLIADKKIPPIVTIFIDSTETRYEELTCNDTFVDIIVNELLPWVKGNYNISDKADEGIIAGSSLGGLTSSYIGLTHSEIFGNVLSQSGSYWYKPEGYEDAESDCWLATQFEKIDKLPLKFYLNVGVLEENEQMILKNIKLRDVLIAKGYTVYFEEFKSGHDYLCWGETLANGLISLIGI